MDGLPVTIRLLDPPLHEFLPQTEADILELAGALGTDVAVVRATLESLREYNPMLGHRGCRLGITYPEIYEMQVRAIAAAAQEVAERGVKVHPEIMVPLVAHAGELERLRALVAREAAGGAHRGCDRLVRRFLLVRNQRPDADDLCPFTG
jgi:pyruvate,orthophosphate dikinase